MSAVTEIEQPRSWYHEAIEAVEAMGLVADEATCHMGDACLHVRPAPIGWYLDADDICRWQYTFKLPDGRLVCEDCAIDWEENQ